MTPEPARFAAARQMMVDCQIRPNRVTDRRILDAMRTLPRERFLPRELASLAYADSDVPLGGGRVLMAPMMIARLVQIAAPRAGQQVLVVGSGTGYGAAVLAACGARVTALEEDATLLEAARTALAGQDGVTLVAGKLAQGWAAGAPYDLIVIEGAVTAVPPAIARQLRAPAGRLVTVLAGPRMGRAVVGECHAGALSFQPQFDCATPLLPALRAEPAFVF